MANNSGDQRIAGNVPNLVVGILSLERPNTLEANASAVKPRVVSKEAGFVSTCFWLIGQQHPAAHYLAFCCLHYVSALWKRWHRS